MKTPKKYTFHFTKGQPPFHEKTKGKPYHPTKRSCAIWFTRLNKFLFSDGLPPVGRYVFYTNLVVDKNPSWAYYMRGIATDGRSDAEIGFSKVYPNKQAFLEVFAHELIHHYQAVNGLPMGHGPSFNKWSNKFKKHGLTLAEKYYDNTRQKED